MPVNLFQIPCFFSFNKVDISKEIQLHDKSFNTFFKLDMTIDRTPYRGSSVWKWLI